MRIEFKRLWQDSDGMLQATFVAENSQHRTTHECYLYPEHVREFGEALALFPASATDEAVFEAGSPDPKFYGWLRLRAYAFNSAGHTALECVTETRGTELVKASAQFSTRIEPAILNELGRRLVEWSNSEGSFEFEGREA